MIEKLTYLLLFSVWLSCSTVAKAAKSVVEVLITDDAGRPIEDEPEIEIRNDPYFASPSRYVSRTKRTRFELEYGPTAEAYFVFVYVKRFKPVERRIVITEPNTKIWIALEEGHFAGVPNYSIYGTVDNRMGAVSDLWIKVTPLLRYDDVRDELLTDPDGQFRIDHLTTGRYLVLVLGRKSGPTSVPEMLACRDILLDSLNPNVEVNFILEE